MGVNCQNCGQQPPAGSTFCNGCGAKLELVCAGCGTTPPPASRFCHVCGEALAVNAVAAPGAKAIAAEPVDSRPARDARTYTPKHLADKILQSKSALEGERKQVTVLFADVKGSMELAGQLDAEEWHQILERFFEILTAGVHRFEGTVNQYTGDGIMALFGAPIAHEDHAQRACYAALHLRAALNDYAERLRLERGVSFGVRMGLNSGDVIVGKIGDDLRMDYTAQGHAVGLAQRMEQLAGADRIYLSEHTQRLVAGYFKLRDLGTSTVAGAGAAVGVYELESAHAARTRLEVARARGLSRFVGRADETHALLSALERARLGHGQVVGVVGEPGVGKSRLCFEFAEHCRREGILIFEASCPAHGRNIPLIPILELFRNYFGITNQDTAAQSQQKIAGAMVLLDPVLQDTLPVLFEFMGVAAPDHAQSALDVEARQRRLYALLREIFRIQAERGVANVVLIDDLHWIDPASDAFVAQMVEATAENSRNLLLLNFRPEYTAPWMRRAHYQQLPLVPLPIEALQTLLESLLGRDPSLQDLAQRISRWTGGNPFFTEELVLEMVAAKYLAGSPGAYRLLTDIDALPIPANVRSVLAARIDRLDEGAKRVLQSAAVLGKNFAEPVLRRVLAEIEPNTVGSALSAALGTLIDAEFIYEQALYPEVEYAFKHPLTQEVALGSQLRDRQRRTHRAVAVALEAGDAQRLDENAALIAHHYEQAEEALAAAHWYRRAAEWVGMKDMAAALQHWQKVRQMAALGAGRESTALLAVACSRLISLAWRVGLPAAEYTALFNEGCVAAEEVGDLHSLAILNGNFANVGILTAGRVLDGFRGVTEAVRLADLTGDIALRCGTTALLSYALLWLGDLREAERVAEQVIALADGDPHMGVYVNAGTSALLGVRCVVGEWVIGCTRDPERALRELPILRLQAEECGYPEPALWAAWGETNLRSALGRGGIDALVQWIAPLTEPFGVVGAVILAATRCNALTAEHAWPAVVETGATALRLVRERGAMHPMQPFFLAHTANAHLELGDAQLARADALAGVDYMRETKSAFDPHSYAVLARAQLELREPASEIAATLDEYAALIERTGFHIYEGEMHELRARLAEHEGQQTDRSAALARAQECYTRFGMTVQAARVAEALDAAA